MLMGFMSSLPIPHHDACSTSSDSVSHSSSLVLFASETPDSPGWVGSVSVTSWRSNLRWRETGKVTQGHTHLEGRGRTGVGWGDVSCWGRGLTAGAGIVVGDGQGDGGASVLLREKMQGRGGAH